MLSYNNSASWPDDHDEDWSDYDDEDRYYHEIAELESYAELRMNVETYDDYFV